MPVDTAGTDLPKIRSESGHLCQGQNRTVTPHRCCRAALRKDDT